MPSVALETTDLLPTGESGLPSANLTEILALLEHLSPEELEDLYDQLGIPEDSHLADWIYSDSDNMHIHSYEDQLMAYDEYRAHKIIQIYIPPVLLLLGTFGNIFSFIILKRKAMLKFSTYFYLMILAIADLLVLYIGLLRMWIGELTGFDPRDKADWLCKLTNVFGYTVSDLSVWLIIAVTCERYIVVCHPLKASSFCNTRRAKIVILILLVLLFSLNLHFLWTVQIVEYSHKGETILQCDTGKKHDSTIDVVWPWIDAIVYSFLPFVVIVILNGLIIRQVLRARRHRRELRNDPMGAQRRPSHEGNTRLTIMLLTISFAFLLTTLPMNGVNIAAAFITNDNNDLHKVSKFQLARTITQMLMYVNHSMNFYLYCAAGQKFRHQLLWLVCYARKKTYTMSWTSTYNKSIKRLSGKFSRTPHSFLETDMVSYAKHDTYYRTLKAPEEMTEMGALIPPTPPFRPRSNSQDQNASKPIIETSLSTNR